MTKHKENFAAQLRGLRLLLGQDNKPISGETFAEMSGIALGTVRAIENGLRKLNDEDRQKIADRLCAGWSPQKKRWVDARDGKTVYNRQVYDLYSQAIYAKTNPHWRDYRMWYDWAAVYYLFQRLPDETYRLALLAFHHKLKAIAQEFDAPPDVFKVLKDLAPGVEHKNDPEFPLRSREVFTALDVDRLTFPPELEVRGDFQPVFQVNSKIRRTDGSSSQIQT